MDKTISKKYFIYVRISDDDYIKSIDDQLKICKKHADKFGIAENMLIEYHEQVSGFESDKRKKFNTMLTILEKDMRQAKSDKSKREYGGIIFFKIDRLARNHDDFFRIQTIFDAGYELISATETIENTPTKKFATLRSALPYSCEPYSNSVKSQ